MFHENKASYMEKILKFEMLFASEYEKYTLGRSLAMIFSFIPFSVAFVSSSFMNFGHFWYFLRDLKNMF